ncbi:MmcQ/YjbR family DNA-binding protein [Paenibacillus sp. TRM 82003]|nr:MmcQ/YjbR family DNA-binding protein [Paenibacillus sp. TRM 82003]
MDMESLKEYGLRKTAATEDRPFGPEPLVLKVGGKMFALLSGEGSKGTISLKCDPDAALMLRQEFQGVTPGYHLNKTHWNTVAVNGSVPEKDLLWMVDHSYALVAKSLTRKARDEMGIAL